MTAAHSQIESSTSPSLGEVEAVVVSKDQRNPLIDAEIRRHLGPTIEKSHGRIKIEQIFHLLDNDKAQLFVAVQDKKEIVGVVVTEIVEWISGRRCMKVMLAGGMGGLKMGLMEPLMEKIEEFAMLGICASVMVEGRNGWGRVLPEGYEFSHSVFEKEIL
jgi:hypothetical protein